MFFINEKENKKKRDKNYYIIKKSMKRWEL